jgi:hypothetical protein
MINCALSCWPLCCRANFTFSTQTAPPAVSAPSSNDVAIILPALIVCLCHTSTAVRAGALSCIAAIGPARLAVTSSSVAAPTPNKRKSSSKAAKSSQSAVPVSDAHSGQSFYCLNDASGVDAAVLPLNDSVFERLSSLLLAHTAELQRDPAAINSVLAPIADDAESALCLTAHVIALGASRPYACYKLFETCNVVRRLCCHDAVTRVPHDRLCLVLCRFFLALVGGQLPSMFCLSCTVFEALDGLLHKLRCSVLCCLHCQALLLNH